MSLSFIGTQPIWVGLSTLCTQDSCVSDLGCQSIISVNKYKDKYRREIGSIPPGAPPTTTTTVQNIFRNGGKTFEIKHWCLIAHLLTRFASSCVNAQLMLLLFSVLMLQIDYNCQVDTLSIYLNFMII